MRHFIVVLFSILILCGCKERKAAPKPVSSTQQKPLPVLYELDGSTMDLGKFQDKALFINYWATWCKPCIMEMPTIQRAKDLLAGRGIEFLLASPESREEIEEFMASNNYNLHFVRAGNMEEMDIMGLPTTELYDRAGNLVFSELGFRDWEKKESIDLLENLVK